MAVKKATTTADIVSEDHTVIDGDLVPEQEPIAEVEDAKYVKVTSPFGVVSTVPVEIKQTLLDSGYKVSR